MKKYILFCLLSLFITSQIWAADTKNDPVVVLKWLDNNKLSKPVGVSWGVPWPKGAIKKNQSFSLTKLGGI